MARTRPISTNRLQRESARLPLRIQQQQQQRQRGQPQRQRRQQWGQRPQTRPAPRVAAPVVAVPVAVPYREWSADRQAAFRDWKDQRARRDPEAEESSKLEEPCSDRRRDAEASPARESTARLGRGERDEATGGRKGNRVAVPSDASELD